MTVRILQGDCREVLKTLPDESVQCCVTSPPYWGLRSYLPDGHPNKPLEIGSEPTLQEWVDTMVAVFREVRRVLRPDGTLWLNLGDAYASNAGGYSDTGSRGTTSSPRISAGTMAAVQKGPRVPPHGLKAKDMMGQPWRVAFALQADGWYLRQDIIWHKPNPMPESVRDRCTKAHEYIFLLSKSDRYFFDSEAMKEPAVGTNLHDVTGRTKQRGMADTFKRKDSKRAQAIPGQTVGTHREDRPDSSYDLFTRNRRSVWTIPTHPFKGAHFATFPPALAERCITASCPVGGVVLDPFGGSGTVGLVADRQHKSAILIDLDERNVPMATDRIAADAPLFAQEVA